MATITFRENQLSGAASQWTFITYSVGNYTLSDSTFTLSTPDVKAYFVGNANKNRAEIEFNIDNIYIGGRGIGSYLGGWLWSNVSADGNVAALSTKQEKWLSKITGNHGDYITYDNHSISLNTGSLFDSNNSTTRTLSITARCQYAYGYSCKAGDSAGTYDNWGEVWYQDLGEIGTVTLNAPPVVAASATSSGPYYATRSTYSVNISSLYAQYGGYITSAVLYVGNQSVSRSNTGSLSIALNAVGTFTPRIVATDSRGQTTPIYLSDITVNEIPATTFDCSPLSSTTSDYYATVTTVSTTVSNVSVPFSGSVTETKLTIGNQSTTLPTPGAGTLSIDLNAVGTFTPVVSIKDSYNRTYTKNLQSITVKGYSPPTINFPETVERIKSQIQSGYSYIGQVDDEGLNAVVTANINWTYLLTDLSGATVSVYDEDGNALTNVCTWYKNRSSSGELTTVIQDFSTLSTSDMPIYCHIDNAAHNIFNTQHSYRIAIAPEDERGTGEAIVQTLGTAFYTIDFLAGGHGIAFGAACKEEGFYCNMDAHFKDGANLIRPIFDFFYPIGSYYETSDTTFDPNVTWGGTWVLETAGMVHVSGGTNAYPVLKANNADGIGERDGGEETHALLPGETAIRNHTHTINHGHGFTNPTADYTSISGGLQIRKTGSNSATVSGNYGIMGIGNGTSQAATMATSSYTHTMNTITVDASHSHSCSGGSVSDYTGSSGGLTESNGAAHNNMQPYINVNRWHRTA